jgi:uncharacterized protein YqjF (DUF2071 family)
MPTQLTPIARPTWQGTKPLDFPWIWKQHWYDLAFAHWRVPEASLRPYIPGALEIDTWDGNAWVSIVAFRLAIRRRWLPRFGLSTSFLELNLRTYVRWRDEAGIYFLSIQAGKRASVALARWLTPLPYVYAPIKYEVRGETRHFECMRAGSQSPLLLATFRSSGQPTLAGDHEVNAWLLERYCAFVPDRESVYRMAARHDPWRIQAVDAHIDANQLGMPWSLPLQRQPDAAHFASRMTAWIGRFERLS